MKKPTFKVGDTVRSAPDSSDIKSMKSVWHATVVKVRPADGTPDGYVYETAGKWTGEFASKQKNPKPTLRQLWSNHLVHDIPGTN